MSPRNGGNIGEDFETEFETDELPDGNIIVIFTKCFRCVKCYPSKVSLANGFDDTSFFIFTKCHVDIRKDLYVMSCSQVVRPFSKGSANL